MSRTTTFITILLVLVLAMAGIWWWFFFEKNGIATPVVTNPGTSSGGFTPLNPNTTSTTTSEIPIVASSTSTTTEELPKVFPKVRQLFATPVAYGLTASSGSVYFADRGTGHIYNMGIEDESPTQIINTTVLRVYESFLDPKGKSNILRYIREGSETITTVTPSLVTNNIDTLAISPKNDRMFSIEKTDAGAVGYISKIDGTSRVAIFESPLREWIVSWPEENTITLTNKANRLIPGYLYFLSPKGIQKKVLGPIYGLTTNTSKDAKKVFYSQSSSGNIEDKIYNVVDGTSQTTLFKTLPEKCTWSNIKKTSIYCAVPNEPSKDLPDSWYKGLVQNVDQIWHLDTVTNDINKVTNLFADAGTAIDAVDLVLDQKEQSLFFINNIDLTLWSVNLSEQ